MKIISIILLASIFIFSSCEDFLEVDPANERVISSVEDIRGALGGYLREMKNPHSNTQGWIASDIFYKDKRFFQDMNTQRLFLFQSDELDSDFYPTHGMVYQENETEYLNGVDWKLTLPQEKIWDESYLMIGYFNSLLDELSKLDVTKEEDESVKGEILLQRSWHIFKLIQFFSPFDSNELGIPLNLEADNITDYNRGRRTQSEIYEIIIRDINEVLTFDTAPNEEYHIFYSKSIAHAILAQVYMYKAESAAGEAGDWALARKHAQLAKDGKALASTLDELHSLFHAQSRYTTREQPHALLGLYWNQFKYFIHPWFWGMPENRIFGAPEQYAGIKVTPELFALYEDGDLRKAPVVMPPPIKFGYISEFGEITKKYHGLMNGSGSLENCVMFRIADMHLIIAESYAREGNNGDALDWLMSFKESRNASYNGGDVLQEILIERRKEFVAEHEARWIDMKRNRVAYSRPFSHPKDGPVTYTINGDDFRYAFKIPEESELSYNKDIQQNPGWDNVSEQ